MLNSDFSVKTACHAANISNQWDQFLDNHPDASFYQLSGWEKLNQECFGHKTFYLSLWHKNEITGVFPLVLLQSRLFGRILCSMPFVNFGGPCTNDTAALESLLETATQIAQQENADYLEIRATHILDSALPTATHKVSMTIDLDDDPDTLWNNFSSKHRTNIRRVYKNGITVKSGGIELLDTFYQLLAESWKSLGTPIYQKKYFQRVIEEFGDMIRIFVCYQGDTPIATAFNGNYKHTVEGMWAGGLAEARKLQPNYVLYWEMIKDACERGFQNFHLGRSTVDSGAEQFKKKWNAQQTQLYWQYFLNHNNEMPQLNVDNPKYKLAINLWRQMPTRVTTMLGPSIAKYIP